MTDVEEVVIGKHEDPILNDVSPSEKVTGVQVEVVIRSVVVESGKVEVVVIVVVVVSVCSTSDVPRVDVKIEHQHMLSEKLGKLAKYAWLPKTYRKVFGWVQRHSPS